jgi:D-alanyl-D-alanine carboxypeptidase
MSQITRMQLVISSLSLLAIGTLTSLWLNYSNYSALSNKLVAIERELASTTATLNNSIAESHKTLSEEINKERNNVGNIKATLGDYSDKVESYTDTVSTLQKLSKIDPELLAKYSKVFFLNENYAPARLVEIPEKYTYSNTKVSKIHEKVWPFLQEMIDDANSDGVTIYISSSFRSFNEQQALKGQYTTVYGSGTANSFSADQGYSEHQLGTTVDLIAPGLGGQLDGFDKTKAFEWLKENAYKFGFILSYPQNNKFYIYEPWHWRFVGVKLATYLHKKNINFYDMDQRDIDEYLVNIFD